MAAVTLLNLVEDQTEANGKTTNIDVLLTLYDHLIHFWTEVLSRSSVYKIEKPDLSILLREAQSLRRNWNYDSTSYIRTYLERGEWGRDDNWTALARSLFEVFQALYLLPLVLQERLHQYVDSKGKLPDEKTFRE